jgi:hypothetical protein
MVIFVEGKTDIWQKRMLTHQEFIQFITKTFNREFSGDRKAWIGVVSSLAQTKLKQIAGRTANKIMISSSSIFHVYKKESHNLLFDDILHIVDVINNADTIDLSTDKSKHKNDVFLFKKDINGTITFVIELRISKAYPDGWLDLVTCYRQKKPR